MCLHFWPLAGCSISFISHQLFQSRYQGACNTRTAARTVMHHVAFQEDLQSETEFLLSKNNIDDAEKMFDSLVKQFVVSYQVCNQSDSRQYVHFIAKRPTNSAFNRLDQEKQAMCKRNLGQMVSELSALATTETPIEDKLVIAEQFIESLSTLAIEPQDSFPDLMIYLNHGSKRVAYHRVPIADIIYSEMYSQRGLSCNVLSNFYLLPEGQSVAVAEQKSLLDGQVTAYFWFGLNKQRTTIIDDIAMGTVAPECVELFNALDRPLPTVLHFTEKSLFELRCHIFKAKFKTARHSRSEGLYTRAGFCGYSARTKISSETLYPCWQQTLVLKSIALYGAVHQWKNSAPRVLVEIMEETDKTESIAEVLVSPMVKLTSELYIEPDFPPKLQWFPIKAATKYVGELLAAFELIQLDSFGSVPSDVPLIEETDKKDPAIIDLLPSMQPATTQYRMEVMFWGLRGLPKLVERLRLDVQMHDSAVSSLVDYRESTHNPSFASLCQYVDLELPQNRDYWPAVIIRCVDSRSFGRDKVLATHVIEDMSRVLCTCDGRMRPPSTGTLNIELDEHYAMSLPSGYAADSDSSSSSDSSDSDQEGELDWWSKYYASIDIEEEKHADSLLVTRRKKRKKPKSPFMRSVSAVAEEVARWPRYKNFESPFRTAKTWQQSLRKRSDQTISKIKVYRHELEYDPAFERFADWASSYALHKLNKPNKIFASFRGIVKICRLPLSLHHENSLIPRIPRHKPCRVLVRIYVIKAARLAPKDVLGTADPYLFVSLGKHKISDKDKYQAKQLNPTFGRCFEIEATFPQESQLKIQVLDWDFMSRDDLIGETHIDLESRFYSRHRATCGFPEFFHQKGYNAWRDPLKPTEILTQLCKSNNIEGPTFTKSTVKVGAKIFRWKLFAVRPSKDKLSLFALRHWEEVPDVGCPLVHEHVETRPLYDPKRSGYVQGQLLMWVDLMQLNTLPRPPVDIAPRKPKSYELRIIIWNTSDVLLQDDPLFSREFMSDIYVQGWIKGKEDSQSTDVHYRSLTGEGNFNWRFIFPFDYLEAEEKIIFMRKSTFSLDPMEVKIEPRIQLRVHDADLISRDDLLGSLTLDLLDFPKGSHFSSSCILERFIPEEDKPVPSVNLFRQKRIKGWWPFVAENEEGQLELTGKVEAEFELLTAEEAQKDPVGKCRKEPEPLRKPRRPETTFLWFVSPLKTMQFVIWRRYRCMICKCLMVLWLLVFVCIFFYTMPELAARKLMRMS